MSTAVMDELTETELKYYRANHFELVVCKGCKEWTTFGDSCCGYTECEEGCPFCAEVAGE